MLQIRQATIDDVPILLPLVEGYWGFEGISGFDSSRVSEQLSRLFLEPRLGCGWIAFVDGQPVGYLLAVYVFSLEHLGLTAEIDEFMVLDQQRGHGEAVLQARQRGGTPPRPCGHGPHHRPGRGPPNRGPGRGGDEEV